MGEFANDLLMENLYPWTLSGTVYRESEGAQGWNGRGSDASG